MTFFCATAARLKSAPPAIPMPAPNKPRRVRFTKPIKTILLLFVDDSTQEACRSQSVVGTALPTVPRSCVGGTIAALPTSAPTTALRGGGLRGQIAAAA